MSKDFYSDGHTIQAGAPGSGSGDFKIKTEADYDLVTKGNCTIDATGNLTATSYKAEIFGSDEAKIWSDSATFVYAEGEVNIGTGDGTSLYIGSDVQLNRAFIITNGGADITGDVKVVGDLNVSGTINGGISGVGISSDSDINITTTNSGNINLDSSADVSINAESEVSLTADNKIRLETNNGGTEIVLTESTDSIQVSCGILNVDIGTTSIVSGGGLTSLTSTTIDFNSANNSFGGSKSSGYIVTISNTSSSSNADVLNLDLTNVVTPGASNNWIQFNANGSPRGSIQGASSSRGYYVVYNDGAFGSPVDPDDKYAITGNGIAFITDAGNVQYASGNEDFGEWIPLGDESEWGITEENRQELSQSSLFPVQEGVILYIRDSKVWKSGPGRGMIATNRAIVVGNQNFKEDGKLGIIMSFIGQVPTFVEGAVEDGDLLVPVENTNHCRAINPDLISFQDYRKAVGTAWGKKLTTELGLVNCAIGIK